MALPIVHATAGYLIYRLDRRREPAPSAAPDWGRAVAFMALANLPDVDFLLGFALGQPGDFHRGVSHTVVAALVVGMLLATVTWWRQRGAWWPAALTFTAVYASHLVVDAMTIDAREPAGAPFFWPVSDAYFMFPFTIFNEILIDGRSRVGFIASIVQWPTVPVLAREAMLAAVTVIAFNLIEGRAFVNDRRETVERVLAADSGEKDLA